MRIVVQTEHRNRIGGVETYVERVLELLVGAGHEILAVFDHDCVGDSDVISVPRGVQIVSVDAEGIGTTRRRIAEFARSVVFAHSIRSPLLADPNSIGRPVAVMAHDYVGSCIAGLRLNRQPEPRPCDRPFGPGCLASYFPRQCGGRSPLTMIRSYRREVRNRDRFSRVELVIANSTAVAEQLAAGGIDAQVLHPFVGGEPGSPRHGFRASTELSLLFLGRFVGAKGGDHLLTALPLVAARLGTPIRLTMAGDGAELQSWKQRADGIAAGDPRLTVEFPGWLSNDAVGVVCAASDLLVIPSVWPEPFGLVGLEAARYGLPAAAFAVGGVPEWLTSGVNGHLADGKRCLPEDLADAIVKCLSKAGEFQRLSAGAVARREVFSQAAHLDRLVDLLASIETV